MNIQVSQNCLAEAKDYPDAFQEVRPSFSGFVSEVFW